MEAAVGLAEEDMAVGLAEVSAEVMEVASEEANLEEV